MGRLTMAALFGVAVLGCTNIQGNGVSARELRELPDFDSVGNGLALDVIVEVAEGTTQEVVIDCDENLLPHIETSVEWGTLLFETDPLVTLSPRTSCVARVRAPRLVGLASSGSGSVVASGALDELEDIASSGSGGVDVVEPVTSDSLSIEVSGSGSVIVASFEGDALSIHGSGSGMAEIDGGRAALLSIHSSGSGGVRAAELEAARAEVTSSGSGDVELTATGALEARLSGSGNVIVSGDPADRDAVASGSGVVIYP